MHEEMRLGAAGRLYRHVYDGSFRLVTRNWFLRGRPRHLRCATNRVCELSPLEVIDADENSSSSTRLIRFKCSTYSRGAPGVGWPRKASRREGSTSRSPTRVGAGYRSEQGTVNMPSAIGTGGERAAAIYSGLVHRSGALEILFKVRSGGHR